MIWVCKKQQQQKTQHPVTSYLAVTFPTPPPLPQSHSIKNQISHFSSRGLNCAGVGANFSLGNFNSSRDVWQKKAVFFDFEINIYPPIPIS